MQDLYTGRPASDSVPVRACITYDPRYHSLRAVHSTTPSKSLSRGFDSESDLNSLRVAPSVTGDYLSWSGSDLDFEETASNIPCRGIRYDPRLHSLRNVQKTAGSSKAWFWPKFRLVRSKKADSSKASASSTASNVNKAKASLDALARKFMIKRRKSDNSA